jgi:hypothetical protein
MFEEVQTMASDTYMDDIHLRIARVTEDLRAIQQELNCAAMQAPGDPELMETLHALSEAEPITVLRSAVDQMRHFLWFYAQVVGSEPEIGDRMRQSEQAKPDSGSSRIQHLSPADEAVLLRYLAESKDRKPN